MMAVMRVLVGAIVVVSGLLVGMATDHPLGKQATSVCTVDEVKTPGTLVGCQHPGGRYR